MHEISVLDKAVKSVEKVALENNIQKVKHITLEVGELTGYLPVFFEKYFPIVVEGKDLFSECELRINEEVGEALCTDCHSLYNVMKHEGACPRCKSRNKTILSGQDFLIKDIGY